MPKATPLNRSSYEPAYMQLVNILRQQIAAGIYRPHNRLPSEAQLCKQYRISPMTVRRAVNVLLDQGVVHTVQGQGTFVRPMKLGQGTFHLTDLEKLFSDEDEAMVRLLEARIVSADAATAERLALAIGERVIRIRRLILQKGNPALYHREYMIYDPARPIVEGEMEVTSLKRLFTGAGDTELKKGELTIKAVGLEAEEAEMLKASVAFPAFRLEHVFYDFENRPVSWGWFTCRADRLEFYTTVGIWD